MAQTDASQPGTLAVIREKAHWLLPLLWDVAAQQVRGDSARKSFWSWSRWWRQRRFLRQQGIVEDLFRNIEYGYSEWALDLRPEHRLADIGTGHTVFAGYMAQRTGCSLVAIDYDRYCEDFQRDFHKRLGLRDAELLFCDATATGLPDGSFDRIVAVSVIEHFPGDGDMRFMTEAARLLRPGGRVVVTVPYSPEFREDEQVAHYHGFERRYDRRALDERIIAPATGLRVRDTYFINQRPGGASGRRLVGKYGSLNSYFGKWYEWRNNLRLERYAVLLTRGLLDIADTPDETSCGAMLTLEKPR